MPVSQRPLHRIGAAIAFGVAALVVVVVIPQVRTDPVANRDAATVAFLVNALLNALVGFALRRNAFLWGSAVITALLGLALADAAFAFMTHPRMVVAAASLFVCVGGDIAVGVLAIIAAVRRGASVTA